MSTVVTKLPLTVNQRITELEHALKGELNQNRQLRSDFRLMEQEMDKMKQNMEALLDGYLTLLNIAGHLAQRNDGV